MVFRRMLRAMGVGGPSVETELVNPNCRPGAIYCPPAGTPIDTTVIEEP